MQMFLRCFTAEYPDKGFFPGLLQVRKWIFIFHAIIMLSRRNFLHKTMVAGAGACLLPDRLKGNVGQEIIMTVNGQIRPGDLRFTLSHEHIMVDFIGAGKVSRERYRTDDVFNAALPILQELKEKGCTTFIDCTPAFLGRDVELLQRLSKASGLNMITNTGYYGAAGEKYLPGHVYTESAEQIASRWTNEWTQGIDGTGVRPGFIKTGVDKAPLTAAQRTIIEAAAITHLATGLTIGVHTGNGEAAVEQLKILKSRGVSPSARIWIHAQNEQDMRYHTGSARQGSWVSFDGVNPKSKETHIGYLKAMKTEKLLHCVLVSQDSGWYHIGEPGGGDYKNYNYILTDFIPALRHQGFTGEEIDTLFIRNPAKAFTIGVRGL
jgi:phosphotriesterase-related protein